MNHFFIDPALIRDTQVFFPPDLSHQIVRVLRLKQDELVIVLDNLGNQFEVRLEQLDPRECIGTIMNSKTVDTEPELNLHLMVAVTQREKFEWILQKCCELGVKKITPVITERSISISKSDFSKKKERWNRILKEAAEQSRRGMVPDLESPLNFDQALLEKAPRKLIAWENEQGTRLQDVFEGQSPEETVVCIGPEGGFSEQEIQSAIENGWQSFRMGKRILRMETAAIVVCALLFQLSGDI